MTQNTWTWRRLGDFAQRMQYGLSVRGDAKGRYPILRMNCQQDGRVVLRDLQYIDLDADTARTFRVQPGDLLFNRTNSYELVGRTAIVETETEAVFASYLVRVSLEKSQLDPHFLNFFLNWETTQHELKKLASRAIGQANISAERLRGFVVPVPPIDEQRSIAAALTQVRKAVALQDSCTTVARHLKSATMRALFTRGLRDEAQKETEIGPMPESWKLVEFGAVREWLQYGTSIHCTYERSEFPVLRIPNIEPGRVSVDDIKFCTLNSEEASRYRLKRGDLIFIRTNGVIDRLGTCAVYAGEPDGALFASYLIRARLKLDQLNPYFAAYFFASELGTRIISGRATPAADGKYNLNTAIIDSLPIPLPSALDEQLKIVQVLDTIDRKIALHRKKRAVLDDLFKTLLHNLMTGEIRASDLDLSAFAPKQAGEATA